MWQGNLWVPLFHVSDWSDNTPDAFHSKEPRKENYSLWQSLFHSRLNCRCSRAFKYLRSGHFFSVDEIRGFLLLKGKKKITFLLYSVMDSKESMLLLGFSPFFNRVNFYICFKTTWRTILLFLGSIKQYPFYFLHIFE